MTKRWIWMLSLCLCTLLMCFAWVGAQQNERVYAEPMVEGNRVNLRAQPGTEFEQVGQMIVGVTYPVIGRSEFFPWLLLADPVSLQPAGWVYDALVNVRGNLNAVPIATQIVSAAAEAALPQVPSATAPPSQANPAPPNNAPQGAQGNAPVQPVTPLPSSTPVFTVAATMQGEVNLRYGPGTEYDRVGVAQAGERFQVTGYHTQIPWIRIRYDASPTGSAWVSQNLPVVEGNIFTTDAISTLQFALPTLTPTPSVIQSSNIFGEPVPLSDDFQALGAELWDIVLNANFDPATNRFGSLFVLDLQTGEAITFGSEFAFSGTSLNKVAILATLYSKLSAPPNAQLATDIANTMICSENAATNELLETIGSGDQFRGAAEVTTMFQQLGFDRSFITYPYSLRPGEPITPPYPIPVPTTRADQIKAEPDLSNQVTVEELGWLLGAMYQCAYNESGPLMENFPGQYEPRECRQMIHVMSNNNVDGMLKAGAPATMRVAHKHGWIDTTHGNAAIFFTPGGDYVAVMMLYEPFWLNYEQSLPTFGEVGRALWNHYNPDQPMQAVREGFFPETATCNFADTPLTIDLRQPVWDR